MVVVTLFLILTYCYMLMTVQTKGRRVDLAALPNVRSLAVGKGNQLWSLELRIIHAFSLSEIMRKLTGRSISFPSNDDTVQAST